MALIDQWIEIAEREAEQSKAEQREAEPRETEQLAPASGQPEAIAPLPTIEQEQLERALREIVPPEMLLRLNGGARFCFPYHTLGRVFQICLEKKNGVLCMRVVLRNSLNK